MQMAVALGGLRVVRVVAFLLWCHLTPAIFCSMCWWKRQQHQCMLRSKSLLPLWKPGPKAPEREPLSPFHHQPQSCNITLICKKCPWERGMLASRVMKGLGKSPCRLDHRSVEIGLCFLAQASGGLQALTDIRLDARFLSTVVKAASLARAKDLSPTQQLQRKLG